MILVFLVHAPIGPYVYLFLLLLRGIFMTPSFPETTLQIGSRSDFYGPKAIRLNKVIIY